MPVYRLTGRPDYILEEDGERFPMECKSRDVDARGPNDSNTSHSPRAARRIDREHALRDTNGESNTATARSTSPSLRFAPDVRRNHASAARCRDCGFRRQCTDVLQS